MESLKLEETNRGYGALIILKNTEKRELQI